MQIIFRKFPCICFVMMALLVLAASPCFAVEGDLEEEVQQTIQRFQTAEPQTISLFQSAYGYMVFPRIEKGAAIAGGAYGEGLVYEQGKLVGQAKMTHITVGVQAGGGTYAEVIFFENESTMNPFKKSEIIASKQASAFGPHDSDSANLSDRPGMSIFTLNRTGGFLEASVGAEKITFCPLAQ